MKKGTGSFFGAPQWTEQGGRTKKVPVPFFAAVILLVLTACPYSPTLQDCSVRCGPDDACPTPYVCQRGFCRPAEAPGACDCRPGEERPCGGGKGECTPGVQRCSMQGQWATCLGEGKPVSELCDNKDNDCNGVTDDVATGDSPACGLSAGVCAGRVQACVAGQFQACMASDYGPNYEPFERSCDTFDNDCDGNTDGIAMLRILRTVSELEVLGWDAGFAVVYSYPDAGGSDVWAAAYDRRLQPVLGPVKLGGGSARIQLAAASAGNTVWAAWADPTDGGGELQVVKLVDGTPTFPPVPVGAEVSGTLRAGASADGTFTAGWRAVANTRARAWTWPADGGAPRAVELNELPDGGRITEVVSEANVSDQGDVATYRGFTDFADGGSFSFVRTLRVVGPPREGNISWGANASIVSHPTGELVGVWDDSFNFPFLPSYSRVRFAADLWDGGTVGEVKRVSDATQIHSASAVSMAPGVLVASWTEGSTIFFGTQVAGANFRVRTVMPLDSAAYAPVARPDGDTMFFVISRGARTGVSDVYATRVCPP